MEIIEAQPRRIDYALRRLMSFAALPMPALTSASGKCKRALDLVSDLPRHKGMVASVSGPTFATIRKKQPKLTLKYLHPRHLVMGLSTCDRAAAMARHYAVLRTRFDADCVGAILNEGAFLWNHENELGRHAMILKFSHPTDNEGELTIEYTLDEAVIYVSSFTFVPGCVVGVEAETVLLLTRIQGTRALFHLIRDAMKSMHGLGLPAILMAAMEGLAKGLGLNHIVGVSGARQVSNLDGSQNFVAGYDEFFLGLGATRQGDFYDLALPMIEKPMSEIKSSNRKRVRAQRELKCEVARSVQENLGLTEMTAGFDLPEPDRQYAL